MCTKEQIREVLRERDWFVPNLRCSRRTSRINTKIELMQKDIKTLLDSQGKILNKLDSIEEKFAKKWTEKWIIAVTIMFALASLYLIFNKVGLPH